MRDRRFTRRRLLVGSGTGVLGIAVVSTIAGCSSSSPRSESGSTDGTASGGPSLSTAADFGDWHRVDLSFVSAYLLIRGGEAAVVDLGTPGSGGSIEAGLQAAGVGWNAVRHVILTHQHSDHVGAASEVAPKVTAGSLYSGAADVAGINSPTPVKPLNDGDEIFGLRIIGTPGHTSGHISVFDPSVGVLVAGDALRTNATGLVGPDPRYTYDEAQAAASVRKLATLDVRTILPGHGNPMTAGAAEALKTLAGS
jgi:glyoxylase-like metal-dependent hydrolase (beta-lactamase superfamily II)